jgi:hypothetical protein
MILESSRVAPHIDVGVASKCIAIISILDT